MTFDTSYIHNNLFMNLQNLGFSAYLEEYIKEQGIDSFTIARVISEHRERYIVRTAEKEFDAEILGNMRFTAQSRADFPAVGDWVSVSEYDTDKVLIHSILPRKTILERQSVSSKSEKQIIATNIDSAIIILAADRDFSVNRIERYLTICNASNIESIIVLNKIDLINESALTVFTEQIKKRIPNSPLFAISNQTKHGIEEVQNLIQSGKTYCLLGSSGVGKSSLLNNLVGKDLMKTNSISEFSNRGQHVTTHRELHILENGGIIIDNPGMREIGIADSASGLEVTFEKISELSEDCKFRDCTHTTETGCAVLEALEMGYVDESSYNNYLKMEREKSHYESTIAEKRQKDKDFGKMVKSFKKMKKRKS